MVDVMEPTLWLGALAALIVLVRITWPKSPQSAAMVDIFGVTILLIGAYHQSLWALAEALLTQFG